MRQLLRAPGGVVGVVLTGATLGVGLLADALAPSDPFRSVGAPLRPPSGAHLMGTDNLGRDLFSAVVQGARTSMIVVVGAAAIASAIGLGMGALSGYRGGVLDDLLMRLTEMFQSVPRFFLALLVVALFGADLKNLVLVLGLTSWPLLARVVRAESLSVRQREFVQAARAVGASDARVIVRHVLPNVFPAALVVIALMGSRVIVLEASLSFLGLGDPNAISWGLLASNSQEFMRVAWWMTLFPGVAIVIAVLGLNLLSDALNDVLNPLTGRSAQSR